MSNTHIHYTPHPNVTQEVELDALSAVYALALRKCQERKEAAHPAAPNDDVKESDGYVANPNYTK